MSSLLASVYLPALGRFVFAAILVASFSLIGFGCIPASFRPRQGRLSVPLGLSFGAVLFGWCAWIAGTLFGTPAVLPCYALLLLLSLPRGRTWWQAASALGREVFSLLAHHKVLSALLALPIVAILPQLLLPVVDSDGLRYHLALPRLFLLTGHVFYYRWDVTGAFPQTSEMIYLLAMKIAGGETAKFIHAFFFVANLVVLILLLHRDHRSRASALLAPFLFAVSPVVLAPAASAFIDHIALFHVAVAVLLIMRGTSWIAGLPLGAAMATKITTAPAIAAAVMACLVQAREHRGRLAAALILPVVIFFAPFAIRNVMNTGDPFYPIGYGLLNKDIPGLRAGGLSYASQYHANISGVVGIPWQNDTGVQPDEVVGLHHLLGLFTLLLAVRDRRLLLPLLIVLAYLGVAVLFRAPARYFLPMLWALSIFEATALAFARRWAIPMAVVLALPAALGSASALWTFGPPFPYLRGEETANELRARLVPGYRVITVVNTLPAGGSVMAMDFPAPYYLNRPWIVEGILHDPPLKIWLDQGLSPERILQRLKAMDVRYVLVTPGYGGGTKWSMLPLAGRRQEIPAVVRLRGQLRLISSVDGVDVYAVP
ncbi:MAG: glycosyltransferase 87 family protein [Acidobacteriota bacterium]